MRRRMLGWASAGACGFGVGAAVVREAVSRANVAPSDIGHVVFGNVMHTDARDMYLARYAGVRGGLPIETPMFTLNRLCGSGLDAVLGDRHLAADRAALRS